MFTKESRLYRSIRPSIDPAQSAVDTASAGPARVDREPLTGNGAIFLARMAGTVRLAQTAIAHPEIINRLAACGNQPRLLIKLIDRLLIDEPPGPRGFAREVVMELGKLRELCADRAHLLAERAARAELAA